MIARVHPTGFAAEAFRVERDGAHLFDLRLEIHATGRGSYFVLSPAGGLAREGTFAFDTWTRDDARKVVGDIVHTQLPDAQVEIEITRPTR